MKTKRAWIPQDGWNMTEFLHGDEWRKETLTSFISPCLPFFVVLFLNQNSVSHVKTVDQLFIISVSHVFPVVFFHMFFFLYQLL